MKKKIYKIFDDYFTIIILIVGLICLYLYIQLIRYGYVMKG
jgi:hypothetical protein